MFPLNHAIILEGVQNGLTCFFNGPLQIIENQVQCVMELTKAKNQGQNIKVDVMTPLSWPNQQFISKVHKIVLLVWVKNWRGNHQKVGHSCCLVTPSVKQN